MGGGGEVRVAWRAVLVHETARDAVLLAHGRQRRLERRLRAISDHCVGDARREALGRAREAAEGENDDAGAGERRELLRQLRSQLGAVVDLRAIEACRPSARRVWVRG